MAWDTPTFAHMPLLHGADGKKLSKRHGALGVEAYRDMGFLPEAVNNYLLRLGWGHGDDEIISRDQAIEWFDIADVGKGAARFDMDKLTSLNAHYIRESDNSRLTDLVWPFILKNLGNNIDKTAKTRLITGMSSLKKRAKNIIELAENSSFYVHSIPLKMNEKATAMLNEEGIANLQQFRAILNNVQDWSGQNLHHVAGKFAVNADLKLGKIAQPLRAALTGSNVSPGVFAVMEVLGRDESLARIDNVLD